MKNGSVTLFAGLLTAALLVAGCGQKYAEVKESGYDFIELVEEYTADIEQVSDAKGAARAINDLADGLEKIMPRMLELEEKYPELEDEENLPEELQELRAKSEEVMQGMQGSMMKIMAYMRDPEVMKAQQRLVELMSKQ